MKRGRTSGHYDPSENVLHLWYEEPIHLHDEATLDAFFEEVEVQWVRTCPAKPYLLVNYAGVHIAPTVTEAYARRVERLKALVVDTFRYHVGGDLTGVAIAMGNMSVGAHANIYPDEARARAAIRARAARR